MVMLVVVAGSAVVGWSLASVVVKSVHAAGVSPSAAFLRYWTLYPLVVRPFALSAVHVTSRAGSIGALEVVRASVGLSGFPVSTFVTLMITSMAEALPSTV